MIGLSIHGTAAMLWCCDHTHDTAVSSIVISPHVCCYMSIKIICVSNYGNNLSALCCFRYHLSTIMGFRHHMRASLTPTLAPRSPCDGHTRKVLDHMAGAGVAKWATPVLPQGRPSGGLACVNDCEWAFAFANGRLAAFLYHYTCVLTGLLQVATRCVVSPNKFSRI
jgi:hypothetical protein